MGPGVRKLSLTAHVVFSVGWLGAVVAFLGLAILGLTTDDIETVRTAYVSTEVVGFFVVLPLCVLAFITGLIQSLGTPWGLIRHYWVLVKLVLTVVATAVLVLHLSPIARAADIARTDQLSTSDLSGLRGQLVVYAVTALAVLLMTASLSVFKPAGQTRYGRRARGAAHSGRTGTRRT